MSTDFSEAEIESAIQAKGLNASRITPQYIDGLVSHSKADYHVFPGTTVTVCCLTVPNGYSVIGHSAAASPENFDPEIGQQIALTEARNKLWALEGYLLCEALSLT